jgi:hypothetical protein
MKILEWTGHFVMDHVWVVKKTLSKLEARRSRRDED